MNEKLAQEQRQLFTQAGHFHMWELNGSQGL